MQGRIGDDVGANDAIDTSRLHYLSRRQHVLHLPLPEDRGDLTESHKHTDQGETNAEPDSDRRQLLLHEAELARVRERAIASNAAR